MSTTAASEVLSRPAANVGSAGEAAPECAASPRAPSSQAAVMRSGGNYEAPVAPPAAPTRIEPTQAARPSAADFVGLLETAARQGTIELGKFADFDQVLYYLHDVPVNGKRYGEAAAITYVSRTQGGGDAPSSMSVKATADGYEVTSFARFRSVGPFALDTTEIFRVAKSAVGLEVTLVESKIKPANRTTLLAAPALLVGAAFQLVAVIWKKMSGK